MRPQIQSPPKKKKKKNFKCQWFMPVILAAQVAEIGGSWFEASSGTQFVRPYLKNIQPKTKLMEWLKW
jgi:hypothetical protein